MKNKRLLAGIMMGLLVFSSSAFASGDMYDHEHDPDHERLKQHELAVLKKYTAESQIQADALYNTVPDRSQKFDINGNEVSWYNSIKTLCSGVSHVIGYYQKERTNACEIDFIRARTRMLWDFFLHHPATLDDDYKPSLDFVSP